MCFSIILFQPLNPIFIILCALKTREYTKQLNLNFDQDVFIKVFDAKKSGDLGNTGLQEILQIEEYLHDNIK